jgi:DnaJ-class molecular chaperone
MAVAQKDSKKVPCTDCNGTGKKAFADVEEPCATCDGTGKVAASSAH